MNRNPRIVFMGTPEFAATVLLGLLTNDYQIVGVISQPDRPVGRKQEVIPTPVKAIAQQYKIPVFQVERIRKEYAFVRDLAPDLIITCAYGQIVPKGLLEIPPLGCLNVHASLLPKLRGGAPIHRSIMEGEKETGVTIMEMIEAMDAGRIFAQASIAIEDHDTLGTLSLKLQTLGTNLLLKTFPDYIDGNNAGIPQEEDKVTFGYTIKREEERINWNNSSIEIHNLIRALNPVPGAYTMYQGQPMKVWDSEVLTRESQYVPGTVFDLQDGIIVATKDGAIRIIELQIAGKKRMSARAYLNGTGNSILLQKFE